jgi:uncharacterized membrane protein YdjX (TVP38/TMEM64 family)
VQAKVRLAGGWAPVWYLALSTILGIFFVPRTVFLLIAGMSFGWFWGTVLGLSSAVATAILSFGFARYVASAGVRRLIEKSPKARHFSQNVESTGFNFVLFTRFLHLPFSLMNYALALLPVRFRDYVLGSAIGLLPGTLVVVYLGQGLGCLMLDGKADIPPKTAAILGLSLTMLAFLSLVPVLISRKKQKLLK